MAFIDKPTNPEPTPEPPPPSGSHTLDHCLPALVTAWPGTRHIETAPVPQNPLKLLTLANPKPAVPALPVFSIEPAIKVPARMFHLLPLPPNWLRWFQTELTGGAGCVVSSFLLGFRNIKSCLFSGTYILLCWPCCTSVQFNPVANRGFLVVFFEIPGWKFEGALPSHLLPSTPHPSQTFTEGPGTSAFLLDSVSVWLCCSCVSRRSPEWLSCLLSQRKPTTHSWDFCLCLFQEESSLKLMWHPLARILDKKENILKSRGSPFSPANQGCQPHSSVLNLRPSFLGTKLS